jgi:hypothetical protein
MLSCFSKRIASSFPKTNTTNVVASKFGSASGMPQANEECSVSQQLLAHMKLLLRRRDTAVAALDAGFPMEAARQFSKVLDARRGVLLPHPFAMACLVGRAMAFRAAGRLAEAIADCNRALALESAFIPALRARADLLESIGMIRDSLWDLDYLKLLSDVALRDAKLRVTISQPQGGVGHGEIAAAHRELLAHIQQLRDRVTADDGCGVDYYALLGVRRGCTRSELVLAHRLLTIKLKPDRSASFLTERLELVNEHRDLDAVRHQARISALILYRTLQKGFSHISAVLDEEDAEQQRNRENAVTTRVTTAASAPNQEEE